MELEKFGKNNSEVSEFSTLPDMIPLNFRDFAVPNCLQCSCFITIQ